MHLTRLQTWTHREGNIRLSTDDGPPSHEFLDGDDDEEGEALADDEPLSLRAQRLKSQLPHTRAPHEHQVSQDVPSSTQTFSL